MVTLASAALEAFDAASMGGGVNVDFDLGFVVQMLVFATLVLVLKPLLFDPVLRVFEEREKRTDGARAVARELQEKSGELLRKYEHELERVNRAAAEERDRIRTATGKLEAEILEEARKVSQRIVDEGRQAIAEELHSIRFDLGKQSERIARDMASRVLGRELS